MTDNVTGFHLCAGVFENKGFVQAHSYYPDVSMMKNMRSSHPTNRDAERTIVVNICEVIQNQ